MSADLIDKLNAALQTARNHATKDLAWISKATAEGDWTSNIGINLDYSEVMAGETVVARTSGPNHDADAQAASRAVRWMKRRAEERLRQIEAHRKILDRWEDLIAEVAHWRERGDEDAAPVATEWAYRQVVQQLAEAYGIEVET